MRVVTLSVTLLVSDDAQPEKWIGDFLADSLEDGEALLDCSVVSDEITLDEVE